MTHEEKLLKMIRDSSDPATAAEAAISAILCYVKQLQPQATYYPIPIQGFVEKE